MKVSGCSSVSYVNIVSSNIQVLVMERLMDVSDELEQCDKRRLLIEMVSSTMKVQRERAMLSSLSKPNSLDIVLAMLKYSA